MKNIIINNFERGVTVVRPLEAEESPLGAILARAIEEAEAYASEWDLDNYTLHVCHSNELQPEPRVYFYGQGRDAHSWHVTID